MKHLIDAHKMSKARRDEVQQYIETEHVQETVTEPPHGSAPISGLQILSGWQCNVNQCSILSQSKIVVEKHCSKEHGMNSKRRREEVGAIVQVSLQHWFAKSNKYWIVDFRATTTSTPTTPTRSLSRFHHTPLASSPTSTRSVRSSQIPSDTPSSVRSRCIRLETPIPTASSPRSSVAIHSTSDILSQAYDQIIEEQQQTRRIFREAEHPSELTPWNHVSRYYLHFTHVDMGSIAAVVRIPRQPTEHARLFYMVQSMRRVLRRAYREVPQLHPVVAKRLNSFESDRIRADPFTFLQNANSFQTYLTVFGQMICYIYRVHDEDPFEQPMFHFSSRQQATLDIVTHAVDSLADHLSSQSTTEHEPALEQEDTPSTDPQQERLETTADEAMLSFLTALLLHPTQSDSFHSAMFSFCAAISWSSQHQVWKDETQSGSLLSQMIYCCQLVIIAHSRRESATDTDFVHQISEICRQWAHHDSFGPLSDMLRLRLYAMSVSRQVVRVAPIRWRNDGETLMYQDITYRISDLAREMTFALRHARDILHRDLCFGLPDVPHFDLRALEDNWDDKSPGASFLTDARNAVVLTGHHRWLMDQIAASHDLYDTVMQHANDVDTTDDAVRPTFAQEYEASVQQFLEYLAILVHKGSGQPARMTEFLSLRWQNMLKGNVSRSLYVHDGYLLFVLDYHKTRHASHASRYPVRFLLPEVAQLLVQFLVLVMPLRLVFSRHTHHPEQVSEYLWHDGTAIWTGAHITRIGRSVSQRAHGVAVNMASWRQLAVGIAIKRFSGTGYQADMDMPTDDDDDLGGQSIMDGWGGAMADVFHHQSAHSVHTGNRHYGGTVNFRRGLTDAGLQEYFKASRLWHQLCLPPRSISRSSVAGHRRHASSEPITTFRAPLRQRLTFRARPIRHRLRWGTEQVHYAMRQLFPRSSPVAFRSPAQEELIEAIVSGCPEVVGVLATGGGKSLAFLLPPCLPRAGMTVVIVPLVALKADMVRRCRDAGLSYAVWQRTTDATQFWGTPLLFVSVEQAVRRPFRAFLGQQDANEALDRVVIDEAHLVLTAQSYRPKMALIRHLRQLHCPIVCLTATLPPLMQPQFDQRMFLQQPRVIRARTFRSDITYRLRPSREADLIRSVVTMVRGLLLRHQDDPTARLLVYTMTRATADEMSEQLSCPKYYSDSGNAEEKQAATRTWRDGASKVMVATSAFGMGVDFPSVRHVIHVGAPTDLINFAQEVGRLSRDGAGGFSRVVMPQHWQPSSLPHLVDQRRTVASEVAMQVYLGANRCLSAVLSRFLDGISAMQYCTQVDETLRCSHCAVHGLFDARSAPDPTTWWDSATGQGHGLERDETSTSDEDESDDDGAGPIDPDLLKEPARQITAGSERLRQSERMLAAGWERYRQGLALLRGRCMICMILSSSRLTVSDQTHALDQCRHIQRSAFWRAKRDAVQRNQGRGGWMKAYVACYRCGQPQDICSVGSDRGPADCTYRDLIFPATWAVFHRAECWGRTLGDISGVAQAIWQDERRWMDWLGGECELYGQRASQAARILDEIMQLMLSDVFMSSRVGHLG